MGLLYLACFILPPVHFDGQRRRDRLAGCLFVAAPFVIGGLLGMAAIASQIRLSNKERHKPQLIPLLLKMHLDKELY